RPSAATRPAFLAAAARPLVRSQSIDASMSPLFSASAFLQSIMPAPVRSRGSLTRAAVISAMGISLPRAAGPGCGPAMCRACVAGDKSKRCPRGRAAHRGARPRHASGPLGVALAFGFGSSFGRNLLIFGHRGDSLFGERGFCDGFDCRAKVLAAVRAGLLAATGRRLGDRIAVEADG